MSTRMCMRVFVSSGRGFNPACAMDSAPYTVRRHRRSILGLRGKNTTPCQVTELSATMCTCFGLLAHVFDLTSSLYLTLDFLE
jgi:hypothetical protein